jgi:hypothetical protein
LSATAAAAGELGAKLRQPASQESLHGLSHGLGAAAMEDVDSNLLEPHKWPHTHAPGNKDLYAVLRQMIDWSHAAALLMRHVGQGGDLQHFAFGDFHQGVQVTVAEMGPQRGIESAGMI